MRQTCPHCLSSNPAVARYCSQCGTLLAGGSQGGLEQPAILPRGFLPCPGNEQFLFSWELVGPSSMFGFEFLGVAVLNRGEAVHQVRLRCTGFDADEQLVLDVERGIHRLDSGQTVCVEIARHEIPSAPARVEVSVVAWEPLAAQPQERRSECRPWWSSSWEG